MDDLYTDSAKRVMAIAQEQANYFRHQAIGTEHLLLALTIEDKGVAGQVLKQAMVTPGDVRREIERLAGYGNLLRQSPSNYLPYSPKAKAVLDETRKQAFLTGAVRIGTEHFLLALLSDEAILSSRILTSLHVDCKKLRQILSLFSVDSLLFAVFRSFQHLHNLFDNFFLQRVIHIFHMVFNIQLPFFTADVERTG